ncbi:MAG: hypothetical protein GXO90_05835 [FCB group bacterium]|nr:hypothetical protein [FCB group bacterium]
MTFLSPGILWGLFAAAIPILIHLISQRNTREVEFSSLVFIQELEHETLRNVNLRQWLLILLRTLIILFLVLAFAKPVRQGIIPSWVAGEQQSRIVCLVDNSASMAAEGRGISFLDQAKVLVPEILASIKGDRTVAIYQTTPFQKIYDGAPNSTDIQSKLSDMVQTAGKDHLWSAVDSILVREKPHEPNKEFFILSDLPSLPSTEWTPDSTWRYYLVPFPEVEDNLSIQSAEILSEVRLPTSLLKIQTALVNNGQIEKRNIPIDLYLSDQRVGQVVSTLAAKSRKGYLFQAFPGDVGIIKGRLEIPEDDFSLDNRWTLDISIPEQIVCNVTTGKGEDGFFLNLALSSIDNQADFLIVTRNPNSVPENLLLDESDVFILHNPDFIPDRTAKNIKSFLEAGGSGLIFYGESLANNLSKTARNALGLPVSKGLRQAGADNYYSLNSKTTHAILSDLNLRNLKGELPQVFRYIRLRPGPEDEIILRLTNGDPFLIRHSIGRGSLFIISSLMNLSWNDLPMRGLLVPLLHRLLIVSATDETQTSPVEVGEPKILSIPREVISNQWEVISPSGKSFLVIPDFNTESLIINNTLEVGSYDIQADGYPYASFSTRLAPTEYPDYRADPDRLMDSFAGATVRRITPGPRIKADLESIRYGKSLWRFFLILALFCAVAETIIGRLNPATVRAPKHES